MTTDEPLNKGFRHEVDPTEIERIGHPPLPRQRFEPQGGDWFEEALAKKSRKKQYDVHKHPKMSKTLHEQESERQDAEMGEDAKHDAATVTMVDTLSLSLAKLGDEMRLAANVIEQLLNERLDQGSSADAEEAYRDADRMRQDIETFKENIKAFRKW